MSILPLLLFVLPLGLDTLGVSIGLGIKTRQREIAKVVKSGLRFPGWLNTAILFSLAETLMPLVGLVIGFATSLLISSIMHFVGPLLLMGVGLSELIEEVRVYPAKKKGQRSDSIHDKRPVKEQFEWRRQLILALSISLDELAVGFSLGTIIVSHASGRTIHPIILCILIGVQGFLMTVIGISLGSMLRARLKPVKEWSELLSAVLLVGLGIWLLVT